MADTLIVSTIRLKGEVVELLRHEATDTTTEIAFDPLHLSQQILDPGLKSPLIPIGTTNPD